MFGDANFSGGEMIQIGQIFNVHHFLMFSYHDETLELVSHILLLKFMDKRESNFFVYDCGTHYSSCHFVIFHNKTDTI